MGVLEAIDVNSEGVVPQSVDYILKSLQEDQMAGNVIEWNVILSLYQIYQDQI